jgi:glycosyltransferase involved in cell wall biosynthesis
MTDLSSSLMMHRDNAPSHPVWLLSPYHTGSHRAWALGYQQHSRHQVRLITMAGRFWKWRMQGGAIELAAQCAPLLHSGPPPAAVIATDMVNLPAWLGLMRAHLPPQIPILYYMHENQLTYPLRAGEKTDLTYAMINWTSQIVADQVIFNSHYHAGAWFEAAPGLLKQFPDHNHLGLLQRVEAKSAVLPVGIDCRRIMEVVTPPIHPARQPDLPLIMWNQRWEYDKNPKAFFDCLDRLQAQQVRFQLIVAGENFRNVPREFHRAREQLAGSVLHWGHIKAYADYIAWLQQADLVISTALHEFFGISILEAIVAGAFPLLPKRLSYPELIPETLHTACLYGDKDELTAMSAQRLLAPRPAPPLLQQHILEHYDWPVVAARYDALLDRLIG